jgi:hypothetical protein
VPVPRPAPGTGRWWVVGVVGIALAVALVVWYGWSRTSGAVRPQVTGYEVLSDAEVRVEYDVSRPQGVAVDCEVAALDSRKGRVGVTVDEVPADGPAVVHREVVVRTSARAVTGVVQSCVRVLPAPG